MPRSSGSTNHIPSSFMGSLLAFGGAPAPKLFYSRIPRKWSHCGVFLPCALLPTAPGKTGPSFGGILLQAGGKLILLGNSKEMKPFWSVPSLCPQNNRAPGKQCGKRGGGKLGRDGEAGEEREQPHSCPGTPQFLGIQKLGQGGEYPKGFLSRKRMKLGQRAGCASWDKLMDGHRGAWIPPGSESQGKGQLQAGSSVPGSGRRWKIWDIKGLAASGTGQRPAH